MRLKTTPEEFVVQEATDLRIRKRPAAYRVYLLEKRGWNTADALMRIAREARVPYRLFAYGGKKDRHAHTFQYVTVTHPTDLSQRTDGYRFAALGYSDEPMGPSRILSNRFTLTLRELGRAEAVALPSGLERVRAEGAPNYFDDQRFGNLDRERGLIAEQMLRGRWEDALAIALTGIYPEENKEAKRRKRALLERWGDWAACRELARTALEQRSFDLLLSSPGAFREALATAHTESLQLWIATYQSFLWNEILRRLLSRRGEIRASHPGAAGPYLFPTGAAGLRELTIPLPGKGMRFPEPETGLILEEILTERRLRPATLEEELLPRVWLKASPRPALMAPQGLQAAEPEPDERYPGRFKATLRFALPRGSYATMLVKTILT